MPRYGPLPDRNVDIVPDACPVSRVIIGAVYVNPVPHPEGRIQHQRDEVGLRLMPFADLPVGIGAGRVKIPERDISQPVC